MNPSIFSIFTLPIYTILYWKMFNNKIHSAIFTCILAVLLLSILNIPLELMLTAMSLLLIFINYQHFNLSKATILCFILQLFLLLCILIFSVNTWDFTDLLAANSLQILGILLLLIVSFCFMKYQSQIESIYASFSKREKLFLLLPSFITILFMSVTTIFLTRFLDYYWSILAYISCLLWQLFCFYIFYMIEIEITKEINKDYVQIAEKAQDKEIIELINMKQEIVRTYHELDNIKLLKQYFESESQAYKEKVKTGYPVLDFILNEEMEKLQKAGFQIKLMINFSSYPLNETETISLFRNLFDNLLNHASTDESISLQIIEVKQTLLILCSNLIKLPSNSKRSWKHGHGLSIMDEIVKQHNGILETQITSHYHLKLIIPLLVTDSDDSSQ